MVEHWSSYIAHDEQMYKTIRRTHLTRIETSVCARLRTFVITIRERLELGDNSVMHDFEMC